LIIGTIKTLNQVLGPWSTNFRLILRNKLESFSKKELVAMLKTLLELK